MGRSYLFECPKCTYKTTVSGGVDHGQDCTVQTIACRDCRKLFDAIIRLRVLSSTKSSKLQGENFPTTPPPFEEVVSRLPLPKSRGFRWFDFKPQCPVSKSHRVEVWNNPGKCPVCGSFLERDGLPFRLWE